MSRVKAKLEVHSSLRDVIVSQQELATEWLTLSARRVRELTTSGVLQKTTHGYPVRAAVRSYVNFLRSKTGTLTNERARLTKAQANLAELNLRFKIGELVERRAVERKEFVTGRIVRDRVFNVPDRVSGPVASMTDQHAIHALLTAELRQCLQELTNGTPPDA